MFVLSLSFCLCCESFCHQDICVNILGILIRICSSLSSSPKDLSGKHMKTVLQIQNDIAVGCLKLFSESIINHIRLSAGDQPYYEYYCVHS